MMKPKIGIVSTLPQENFQETVFYQTSKFYIHAVEQGGGCPYLLPVTASSTSIEAYGNQLDGLLLPGGGDISPLYTKQPPNASLSSVSLAKDWFEIALFREMLAKKKPIFGICRGIQVMNLALGGTLIQHIPAEIGTKVNHCQQFSVYEKSHKIRLKPHSQIEQIFGTREIYTNSLHHQSLGLVAKALQVTGVAEDGVVESVENRQGESFLMGVQFHPELLIKQDDQFLKLFEHFVKESEKHGCETTVATTKRIFSHRENQGHFFPKKNATAIKGIHQNSGKKD